MSKTIQDIKNEIELVNETGLEKLLEKGVVVSGTPGVTGIKPPTTLDIVNAISFIETGDSDIEELEDLIRNSGLFEEGEYTLTEKIQRLIDMIKEYQNNNPEISVPENILKSLEGYLLKDKDGLYLTTKESE